MSAEPVAGPDAGSRLTPQPTPTSAPFWEGLRREELILQRCTDCGAWIHYPRHRCPRCLSDRLGWEAVEPVGVVHAHTVAQRATAPPFAPEVPQLIAVVELGNGVHLTTTLVTDHPEGVRVGTPVAGVFDHLDATTTLLRFRPAPASPGSQREEAAADGPDQPR